MKAIEVLDIVNCQCTPQESYSVYRDFISPNVLCMPDEEMTKFMKSFFVGQTGVVVDIKHELIRKCDNLLVIYPTNDEDGELYHDFAPIYEEALFEGKLDNGQFVYIFNLE